MGKRGPKKKLAQLEALEGNPGKRPIAEPTVIATGEAFVPEHINDDAKACIETIKRSMPDGVYALLDGFLLTGFAVAWAWHKKAVEVMEGDDFVPIEVMENGRTYQSAWFIILNQQGANMRSFGDRLGLDPKSRAALNIAKAEEKPKSKFDGLMGGAVADRHKTN